MTPPDFIEVYDHVLDDASRDRIVERMFRPGSINLQQDLADEGGYPYWHCATP